MHTSKRTGILAGMFAGIGGLFQHIWSHGVAEEVTSMAVNGVAFLRKKVGETTADAKTNTADDDLWDRVLLKTDWTNMSTEAKNIRAYCHSLKDNPETHEYGCALVLYIAKKMVRSFETWEKTHITIKPKKGKKDPNTSLQSDDTTLAPWYKDGMEVSSLWLQELMAVNEENRIVWMKNAGVFDLIAPEKPPGFFAKIWRSKFTIILWIIFLGSLLILCLKKAFA